jgi:bifunctional ADP-heptose synthase (sugar kinase/adenylyltransferase)
MVVISDYNKGFLTEEDIAYLAFKHPSVICDTKKKLGDWCKDLRFIKLNRSEYENNKEYIQKNDWILEKLIITLDLKFERK